MSLDDMCLAPIQGTRARLSTLDSCGLLTFGGDNQIVIDGFVSVQVTPMYEDATLYRKRNAQGVTVANQRGLDQFEGDTVLIEFCAIDPTAVALTTGQPAIVSGGDQIGFWVKEGDIAAHWSLEVWQSDPETCVGSTPRYAYNAWPHLAAARLTDITIEDGVIEWALIAASHKGHPAWDPGMLPLPWPAPGAGHRAWAITTIPPPDPTPCGTVPVLIIDAGDTDPLPIDIIDALASDPLPVDVFEGLF